MARPPVVELTVLRAVVDRLATVATFQRGDGEGDGRVAIALSVQTSGTSGTGARGRDCGQRDLALRAGSRPCWGEREFEVLYSELIHGVLSPDRGRGLLTQLVVRLPDATQMFLNPQTTLAVQGVIIIRGTIDFAVDLKHHT
jgi:hypothetical protein